MVDRGAAHRSKILYAFAYGASICYNTRRAISFEFLIECIPKFSSYAMKDFKPQDLEKIDGTDITRYLRHVKLYKKNGRDITNSESAAKRKLCALRRFYEYYCRYEIISLNPTIKADIK
mgnify:CR=1 FL=1